jgi:ADP-ribosyl-[dinitrogen reductase] hydrolase
MADVIETRREQQRDRAVGALVGLAVGDAVGTTLEFKTRDTFKPLTDMVGGGPFQMKPGEWTDDTSMALCLAEELISGSGEIDSSRLLRRFCNWWKNGHNSVTGECFDIGDATRSALSAFLHHGSIVNNEASHLQANGSIMRLAPAAIVVERREDAIEVSVAQGVTTHAAAIPSECCRELGGLLWDLIEFGDRALIGDGYQRRSRASVVSSGHAPATLDAARWSVATTDSFRSAVLRAANLGDDADTVGAVTGQIAGALYGASGIPDAWLAKLAWSDRIKELGRSLWQLRVGRQESA